MLNESQAAAVASAEMPEISPELAMKVALWVRDLVLAHRETVVEENLCEVKAVASTYDAGELAEEFVGALNQAADMLGIDVSAELDEGEDEDEDEE